MHGHRRPCPGCELVAAATADGLLRLLPLLQQPQAGISTAAASMHSTDNASFAVMLSSPGGAPLQLARPWAAMCALPAPAAGLLFAQRGSGKLLFCQHPAELEPGQAADVFLFGSHPGGVIDYNLSFRPQLICDILQGSAGGNGPGCLSAAQPTAQALDSTVT